jgi:simple sugar transport system permease protein
MGQNNEGLLLAAIVVFSVVIGSMDPRFWNLATVFNVFSNSYSPMLFALGVFLVLLMGGIDVSFDAVGICAGYGVALLATHWLPAGNILLASVMAAGIGLALGAFNAGVIVGFRIPVLIATLATRGMFVGSLLAYISVGAITTLPGSLGTLPYKNLVTVPYGFGQSVGLQVVFVPVAVICLLVALALRYTVHGRQIYAIGGSEESARRAGVPIRLIKVTVLSVAGVLAGLGGLLYVSLGAFADPTTLVGNELNVIAAVVIGGASIFGGKGSVHGTVLGVIMISLIGYSLILLGIPSVWQTVAVGVILLLGVSGQLVRHGRGGSTGGLLGGL